MPFGDDKRVAFRHGKRVSDRKRELIFSNNPLPLEVTEWASGFSKSVAISDAPKIRIIAVALRGVTRVTEGLEIMELIASA